MGKHAHIHLEDKDGALSFLVTYSGKFDPESPSHQGAQILTKYMDSIANQQNDPRHTLIVQTAEGAIEEFKLQPGHDGGDAPTPPLSN